MQHAEFIEHPCDDNCKMLFSLTSKEEAYEAKDAYKDDTVRQFMDLLKTDMYANEIEVVRPEFDEENDRIIKLNISVINGNISKNLIRGAVNKAFHLNELTGLIS